MKNKGLFSYENGLLALLSVTFGLVFVDRFALVYLSPFIAKDLGLNNTQVGMLVSASIYGKGYNLILGIK